MSKKMKLAEGAVDGSDDKRRKEEGSFRETVGRYSSKYL